MQRDWNILPLTVVGKKVIVSSDQFSQLVVPRIVFDLKAKQVFDRVQANHPAM
ncbi:hypothetical protein [Burkholderia vietnamiensis]|uniref:hypothetical protein n=1 Tax=Burkholderia vietnamiensis TaxID=60552 RepID=UPI00158E6445|nr:hypothetical protein [Burkholderia vietnamiensis]